jgi:hypothetical protein
VDAVASDAFVRLPVSGCHGSVEPATRFIVGLSDDPGDGQVSSGVISSAVRGTDNESAAESLDDFGSIMSCDPLCLQDEWPH